MEYYIQQLFLYFIRTLMQTTQLQETEASMNYNTQTHTPTHSNLYESDKSLRQKLQT